MDIFVNIWDVGCVVFSSDIFQGLFDERSKVVVGVDNRVSIGDEENG